VPDTDVCCNIFVLTCFCLQFSLYASDFNAESEGLRGLKTFHKGIDYDSEYQKTNDSETETSARDGSSVPQYAPSFGMASGFSECSSPVRALPSIPHQPFSSLRQTSSSHSSEAGLSSIRLLSLLLLVFLASTCQKGILHG
jgi:hypothetical protein